MECLQSSSFLRDIAPLEAEISQLPSHPKILGSVTELSEAKVQREAVSRKGRGAGFSFSRHYLCLLPFVSQENLASDYGSGKGDCSTTAFIP